MAQKKGSLSAMLKREWELWILIIPVIIYFIVFHYIPIYGLSLSFKDFKLGTSIFESKWVGLQWFKEFFSSQYFWRSFINTLRISFWSLLVFPLPIVFALLLNEIRNNLYKKIVQTVSYFPYFISTVIVVSILHNFVNPEYGLINNILLNSGKEPVNIFFDKNWFIPLYLITGVWTELGFSAVVYIAALASVDQSLMDASEIDGASRIQQIWHISIPCILPTIIILFILRMGSLLSVGFEKVLLLYNPAIYDVADVISTYVYRTGILQMRFSYGTAVGLFNSVVNFFLLILANAFSKKVSDTSLW